MSWNSAHTEDFMGAVNVYVNCRCNPVIFVNNSNELFKDPKLRTVIEPSRVAARHRDNINCILKAVSHQKLFCDEKGGHRIQTWNHMIFSWRSTHAVTNFVQNIVHLIPEIV